jgi:ATP-dependent RNA helicase RhlE
VLIVLPTRELVVQVEEEIKKLCAYMHVRVVGVYGASNINIQKQKVYDGCDVLVATPGRLIDLTLSRTLQFSSIKKLVIDEVDEMLNLGFRAQLVQILEVLPLKRQNILFSATLNEEVDAMIQKYFQQPQYVELISRGTPLAQIVQQAFEVPNFYTKVNLLEWLLVHEQEFKKVLVFVKNKQIADAIESELQGFSDDLAVIHSNKSQPHRFEAVKKFQRESIRVLIATDVVARGLDFKDVSHVVNFDLPSVPETYVHRIGRTGREGKAGVAMSFVTEKDQNYLRHIEALMRMKVSVRAIPEDVEITTLLTKEEMPVKRDKNINKNKKPTYSGGGAFHEKKAKNKKVQLGGKRRQEKQRRALEKSRSKRG